jgi:hypothetical protein
VRRATAVTRIPTWRAITSLAAFEVRLQRRDFFPWLAALVFTALTIGFTANGSIELVGERGAIPRTAPWSLAQAMAGVTAFGQVITAIVAATTVLRDVGLRVQPFFLTSTLSWRAYVAGRFVGASIVMLAIYVAIPFGLTVGALLAAAAPAHDALPTFTSVLAPFAVLVLPTVFVVSSLFFVVGARAGTFAPILLLGVGLIGLWQWGLALTTSAHATLGAFIDPFGNAALTVLTRDWSAVERAERAIPVAGLLTAHAAFWCAIAAIPLGVTLWRWTPARSAGASDASSDVESSLEIKAPMPLRLAVHCTRPSLVDVMVAESRFGWRWIVRERGYQALLMLASLNAIAHGWSVATDPPLLLRTLEFHARLFAILVATIYAGELVWRDDDTRIAALFDALAVPRWARLAGRTLGVVAAQQGLVAVLIVVALVLPLVRGTSAAVGATLWWFGLVSAPLFASVTLGALAVHRVVRHKTAAHLLVITAWVIAVAMSGSLLTRPWSAFGTPP